MYRDYRDLLKKIEICFILQQEGQLTQRHLAQKIGDTKSKDWKTHKLLNELHGEGLVNAPNVRQGGKRYCTLTERGKEFVKESIRSSKKKAKVKSSIEMTNPTLKKFCSHIPTNVQIEGSKMNKKHFENWLRTEKGFKETTIKSRISNCKRVEQYEGNLDNHFNRDKLKNLIELLEYSTQDQKHKNQPKHKVPINGDTRNGTATLKQAMKLYREFKVSESTEVLGPGQVINMNIYKQAANKKKKSKNRTKKKWPKWEQPNEKALLKLAKEVAPFIRFLDPQIIHEITEDNRKHQDEWSDKLRKCSVDPNIYLWDGSPCTFPVRRGINEERQNSNRKHPDCLCLDPDGNTFPKHLWAFVFTGCEFRKLGPEGYQLAHLFDHKTGKNKNRWKEEIEGCEGLKNDPKLFGLFTSPTNTVYVPKDFLRPTDHNHRLRTLLQRKAFKIYGDVCRILPPPLKLKPCDDEDWKLKDFKFGEFVGDMTYVSRFLEFRNRKMYDLFKKFHSK